MVQVRLDHTQRQQSAGPQQGAQPGQHGRDLVLGEEDQGEERGDGVEGAPPGGPELRQVPGRVGAFGREVVHVDAVQGRRVRAGVVGLPGQGQHDVRQVDGGDPRPGRDQLPDGRFAAAAADVQHRGARLQSGQQPAPAGQLAVFGGERLRVSGADRVEGDRLQGARGPAAQDVGTAARVLVDGERIRYLSGRHD